MNESPFTAPPCVNAAVVRVGSPSSRASCEPIVYIEWDSTKTHFDANGAPQYCAGMSNVNRILVPASQPAAACAVREAMLLRDMNSDSEWRVSVAGSSW